MENNIKNEDLYEEINEHIELSDLKDMEVVSKILEDINTIDDVEKKNEIIANLFKQIYDELKINYSIETDAVVVMGGGAKILGSIFKKNIKGIIVMDNIDRDVFANARGYKMLMK